MIAFGGARNDSGGDGQWRETNILLEEMIFAGCRVHIRLQHMVSWEGPEWRRYLVVCRRSK